MTNSYLSVHEVADRLGVSVFTIRRYIRAGKLRAIKLDGVYRLSREDLADFLKAREIVAEPGLPAPVAPGGAGQAADSPSGPVASAATL